MTDRPWHESRTGVPTLLLIGALGVLGSYNTWLPLVGRLLSLVVGWAALLWYFAKLVRRVQPTSTLTTSTGPNFKRRDVVIVSGRPYRVVRVLNAHQVQVRPMARRRGLTMAAEATSPIPDATVTGALGGFDIVAWGERSAEGHVCHPPKRWRAHLHGLRPGARIVCRRCEAVWRWDTILDGWMREDERPTSRRPPR